MTLGNHRMSPERPGDAPRTLLRLCVAALALLALPQAFGNEEKPVERSYTTAPSAPAFQS